MALSPIKRGRRAFCCLPLAAMALPVRAAAPLLLAQPLRLQPGWPVAHYLVSEKFDGVRACWDGAVLRFRSGRRVAAPAGFLRRLPAVPLDGELWCARGRFEQLSGVVRKDVPVDAEWDEVRYMVFELPGHGGDFAARAEAIDALAARHRGGVLHAVSQARVADVDALQARLQAVTSAGGEGLMLHRADAPYITGRSDVLLKLKPVEDDEAVVIAHLPGQGRHRGRLGALQVRRDDGAVFRIGTGLQDAQRDRPPAIGTRVTYTYRGLTGTGLPRFPSFLRVSPGL